MENIQHIVNHSEESEKEIEKHLCRRVKELGGRCLKFHSSWQVGYPDRIVMLPWGRTAWFEIKSRGKQPTDMQKLRHKELDRIGHVVHVCDSKTKVDNALRDLGYEV